ncbi:hypothetical protein [Nocardia fluminea]|uniref:hypothetical protein n=1 Tax=Nocardia fluminea TaxID=134984 RepID=UPI0033C3B781
MELDGGMLPIRVDFRAGWSRYVAPNEVGDELMLAYRASVSTRFARLYAERRRPSPQEVSDNAVPDLRTMLCVLLETDTWDQFSATSSAMNVGSNHEVGGRSIAADRPALTVWADRRYIRSIGVQSGWAAAAHPEQITDEILWCAEVIRSQRPIFHPQRDYSRYSVEDLQFQLDRHRLRLLEEWVA